MSDEEEKKIKFGFFIFLIFAVIGMCSCVGCMYVYADDVYDYGVEIIENDYKIPGKELIENEDSSQEFVEENNEVDEIYKEVNKFECKADEVLNKFIEGDFIVTTDEFYRKYGTKYLGVVASVAEDGTVFVFNVHKYVVYNVDKPDNKEFRKFLYDEFELKETKENLPFLFKDRTINRVFMERYYMNCDNNRCCDPYYICYSNTFSFNCFGDWKIFEVVNETEFMSRYEVIEYDK